MNMATGLTRRLGLKGPLIQAPMGGGATTPQMVAAVSNAGALGSLAGAYLGPAELRKSIREVRNLTDRPFAVNLFAPSSDPVLSFAQMEAAVAATRPYRDDLRIAAPALTPPFSQEFAAQVSVVLSERPAVFSFTFGLPDRHVLEQCRNNSILTFGTATTLDEALALQEAGVDAVVAQGAEAGAQRGSFSPQEPDSFIGLIPLVTVLVHELRVPVIAAGGIMNGNGIAGALALGAQAAQLGTAFLCCDESGITSAYRKALLDPNRPRTRPTRAFTGRWARGLENTFMMEMESQPSAILPFPAQNAFTQDIRKKAAQEGRAEYLSLWAGQGVPLIRSMAAGDLVTTLFHETVETLKKLGAAVAQT